MRELGQELGLLVVLEVNIGSGQVKFQAREGRNGADLDRKVESLASFESYEYMILTRFPCACWGTV